MDVVSSIATFALVIVTAVYATAAWKHQKASTRQLQESQQLRWDSLRPVLVLTAKHTRTANKRRVFELANVGPGPAIDLTVNVDGKIITDFYYEDDPDLIGGWKGPCEVLPTNGIRRFSPPPGTAEQEEFRVAVSCRSVYEDVGRFEQASVYRFP